MHRTPNVTTQDASVCKITTLETTRSKIHCSECRLREVTSDKPGTNSTILSRVSSKGRATKGATLEHRIRKLNNQRRTVELTVCPTGLPHQHTIQTTTSELARLECRTTELRVKVDVLEVLTDYRLIDEFAVVDGLCVRWHFPGNVVYPHFILGEPDSPTVFVVFQGWLQGNGASYPNEGLS